MAGSGRGTLCTELCGVPPEPAWEPEQPGFPPQGLAGAPPGGATGQCRAQVAGEGWVTGTRTAQVEGQVPSSVFTLTQVCWAWPLVSWLRS